MKFIITIFVLLFLSVPLVYSQGMESTPAKETGKQKIVELSWKPFDAGFGEAKKSDKKIMLDVYTDWCGWCKRLDRDVYGNENVAHYLKEHYVVIKLNAESKNTVNYKGKSYSQIQIAQSFGVTGYPTIIFFDPNGEPINRIPGFVDAQRFLPIVKYIGEDHYKTMTFEDYQKNNSEAPTNSEKQ